MLYFSGREATTTLMTSGKFNMEDELRVMLTLLSVLAAAMQLKSSLYKGTTTYINKRQAITQEIGDSPCVEHYSYMELRGRTSAWDDFINEVGC